MQEDFKQALKEYLQPVQPTVQTNFSSHNESTILANLYTQSKQRFYLGIGGLFFFAFLVFLVVILAIVIFASAPHETGENKVLQIVTGILLLILLDPLIIFIAAFLPHFFISAVKLDEKGVYLPRKLLLFRIYSLYDYLESASLETSGAIVITVTSGKKYYLSDNIQGINQLVWFLKTKAPRLRLDSYLKRRVELWETGADLSSSVPVV